MNTQTIEIMDVIKSLPPDKLETVRDFVLFLKEQSRINKKIDESDEWSEEDYRDAAAASMKYAEELDGAK